MHISNIYTLLITTASKCLIYVFNFTEKCLVDMLYYQLCQVEIFCSFLKARADLNYRNF